MALGSTWLLAVRRTEVRNVAHYLPHTAHLHPISHALQTTEVSAGLELLSPSTDLLPTQ